MMVHVTRDVGKGEEIIVSYLDDVEALLDREARNQRLESAWGFSCDCAACDVSTPFDVASERRRIEAAGLMEDFQNMQEQVEAMANVLETMDNPGTAAIFGDNEHKKERLKQKRRDMLDGVRKQAGLLEQEGLLNVELALLYSTEKPQR